MDATTLRIILAVVGAIILALIYLGGHRNAKPQGRRVAAKLPGERTEPQIGDMSAVDRDDIDPDLAAELTRLNREITGEFEPLSTMTDTESAASSEQPSSTNFDEAPTTIVPVYVESNIGARSSEKTDRIVTIFVAANEGSSFSGSDIVVAIEKTGLIYGHLGIFHRMAPGTSEYGAIFSVANMVRPGRFDMREIQSLRSPGLTLFMVLPNAKPALDAWDAMLPTAQRLAELLGGQVLDEERNALGRQRIQHVRDELRAYDRALEKNTIKRSW